MRSFFFYLSGYVGSGRRSPLCLAVARHIATVINRRSLRYESYWFWTAGGESEHVRVHPCSKALFLMPSFHHLCVCVSVSLESQWLQETYSNQYQVHNLIEYPVCSEWSPHTCLSPHCSACLQSALSCFQLTVMTHMANYANVWHDYIVWLREVTELKARLRPLHGQ